MQLNEICWIGPQLHDWQKIRKGGAEREANEEARKTTKTLAKDEHKRAGEGGERRGQKGMAG